MVTKDFSVCFLALILINPKESNPISDSENCLYELYILQSDLHIGLHVQTKPVQLAHSE